MAVQPLLLTIATAMAVQPLLLAIASSSNSTCNPKNKKSKQVAYYRSNSLDFY